MIDDRLTDELVVRLMGWRLAPGRYIKPEKSWVPAWKFRPLQDLADAFQLLRASDGAFKLNYAPGRPFSAEIRIDGRVGRASGEPPARTVTLALARALGLEVER